MAGYVVIVKHHTVQQIHRPWVSAVIWQSFSIKRHKVISKVVSGVDTCQQKDCCRTRSEACYRTGICHLHRPWGPAPRRQTCRRPGTAAPTRSSSASTPRPPLSGPRCPAAASKRCGECMQRASDACCAARHVAPRGTRPSAAVYDRVHKRRGRWLSRPNRAHRPSDFVQ